MNLKTISLGALLIFLISSSVAFAKDGVAHKDKVSALEKARASHFQATQQWLEDAHLSCSEDSLISQLVHITSGYDLVDEHNFNMNLSAGTEFRINIAFK